MDWFLGSVALLSAAAAVASAISSYRSAGSANAAYRPYIAVTGNDVHWSEAAVHLTLFVTNSGPAPGRIISEGIAVTLSDGSDSPRAPSKTETDVIYPNEQRPTSLGINVEPGSGVVVDLTYEDLGSRRQFTSRIAYKVPETQGAPVILLRDAT